MKFVTIAGATLPRGRSHVNIMRTFFNHLRTHMSYNYYLKYIGKVMKLGGYIVQNRGFHLVIF